MKSNYLFIGLFLFLSPVLTAANYTINQNQTISVTTGYVNSMFDTWDIVSTVSNKPLVVNYTIGTENNYDFVRIYAIDDSGNQVELLKLSGTKSGSISTMIPNGKARITFRTDGSVNYASNPSVYSGLNISFAVDNGTPVNSPVVNSASFVNAFVYNNMGIGTLTPTAKLDVNGKLRVQGDIYGSDMLTFQDNTRFTVTTSEIPNLRTPSFSMTQYGIAAPATTGSADLWISGNHNIRMFTAGNPTPRMSISLVGNVGIGTINPQYTLDVNGKLFLNTVETIAGWQYSYLHWNAHSLVMGTPVGHYAHNSIDLKPGGVSQEPLHSQIRMYTATNLNQHTLNIQLNSNGNCFFNNPGYVGIGTVNPQYKLDVKGIIRATEVLIQSIDNFPDYVFDKNYELPTLNQVNSFIRENGHLPGIPSAREVKENGMSLVDMQVKLLQKVEELTLYTIQQQEEIQLLKAELKILKQQ